MVQSIYRDLALKMDTVPPGFPATDSGVELQLLELAFTPQQAALASVMMSTPEPASDIATRAGLNPDVVAGALEEMVTKEVIVAEQREGLPCYGLNTFLGEGGIYDQRLPHLGAEMAVLWEQYYQEKLGRALLGEPVAMHRVIPIAETIPFGVEIHPHEQASELLKGAKSWGVRPCPCRTGQKLIGKGCDSLPDGGCLGFAPVEGAFDDSEADRAITLEEALHILHRAGEDGLVHTVGNYRDGNDFICNCCTCCCGILRGVAEFGLLSAVAYSSFRVSVDSALCQGCGDCVERCQFSALSVPNGKSVVQDVRCVGCGQCVTVCPYDALQLQRLPESQAPPLPADAADWAAQQAAGRDVSPADAL